MAISNFWKATIKNISKIDFNTKKNYKKQRVMQNIIKSPMHKPSYLIWDHEVIADDRIIPVRVFRPQIAEKYPLMIFFHGGGWVLGNIDTYDKVCYNLANKTKQIVISVDYRLAPENPFPMGLMDCYAVTKEIFENSHLLGITPDEITLAGDSAGGNLATVVAMMGRDRKEFFAKKQILLYPVTNNDHTDNSQFESIIKNGKDYFLTSKRICDYMDLYVQNKDDFKNPYVAPYLAKDLWNMPKTLVITAEFDPLRDEGEAYGKKLREFGNDVTIKRVEGALHGFISQPMAFSSVKLAYETINDFLKRT